MLFKSIILLFVLLPLTAASLTFQSSSPVRLLQSYGSASKTLELILEVAEGEEVVNPLIKVSQEEGRPVITGHAVFLSGISETQYNVTVEIECEGWVGKSEIQVEIDVMGSNGQRAEVASSEVEVLGVTLYQVDGKQEVIVSGDDGAHVKYASYLEALLPPRTLNVVSYGGDVEKLKFSVKHYEAGVEGFLSGDGVYLTSEGVVAIAPLKYRVGSGLEVVSVELESIELMGESFETNFFVDMGKDPGPPVLVETEGGVVAKVGENEVSFALTIFNLDGVNKIWADLGDVACEGDLDSRKEGPVKFSGKSIETGSYEIVVRAEGTDGVVDVVMLGGVEVRVGSGTEVGSIVGEEQELNGVSGIVPILGGVLAGVVVLLVVVMVALARWSAWRSQTEESSFGDGGGVPFEVDPVFVARDVYGRGSLQSTHV